MTMENSKKIRKLSCVRGIRNVSIWQETYYYDKKKLLGPSNNKRVPGASEIKSHFLIYFYREELLKKNFYIINLVHRQVYRVGKVGIYMHSRSVFQFFHLPILILFHFTNFHPKRHVRFNLLKIFSLLFLVVLVILRGQTFTVILSILKRERERTVNVFDYSFQSVTALRLESS
jgi:hypothetical protein